MNALLRDHLDQAREVNSALKEDIGKLTAEWLRAREELEMKESEWRNEREVRTGYGMSEVMPEWTEKAFSFWQRGLAV